VTVSHAGFGEYRFTRRTSPASRAGRKKDGGVRSGSWGGGARSSTRAVGYAGTSTSHCDSLLRNAAHASVRSRPRPWQQRRIEVAGWPPNSTTQITNTALPFTSAGSDSLGSCRSQATRVGDDARRLARPLTMRFPLSPGSPPIAFDHVRAGTNDRSRGARGPARRGLKVSRGWAAEPSAAMGKARRLLELAGARSDWRDRRGAGEAWRSRSSRTGVRRHRSSVFLQTADDYTKGGPHRNGWMRRTGTRDSTAGVADFSRGDRNFRFAQDHV